MAKDIGQDVRAYIVQCLACFDTPSAVAAAVKKDFGIEVTRQYVETHDPTKRSGERLAKKWRDLFSDSREKFLEDSSDLAISHKHVRLRTLQRMSQKAENMGNMVLAASLLEQAAKEMGEAYTNRHRLEHSNPDGNMKTVVVLPAKNGDS